jgi:hypothetical protein
MFAILHNLDKIQDYAMKALMFERRLEFVMERPSIA